MFNYERPDPSMGLPIYDRAGRIVGYSKVENPESYTAVFKNGRFLGHVGVSNDSPRRRSPRHPANLLLERFKDGIRKLRQIMIV